MTRYDKAVWTWCSWASSTLQLSWKVRRSTYSCQVTTSSSGHQKRFNVPTACRHILPDHALRWLGGCSTIFVLTPNCPHFTTPGSCACYLHLARGAVLVPKQGRPSDSSFGFSKLVESACITYSAIWCYLSSIESRAKFKLEKIQKDLWLIMAHFLLLLDPRLHVPDEPCTIRTTRTYTTTWSKHIQALESWALSLALDMKRFHWNFWHKKKPVDK